MVFRLFDNDQLEFMTQTLWLGLFCSLSANLYASPEGASRPGHQLKLANTPMSMSRFDERRCLD